MSGRSKTSFDQSISASVRALLGLSTLFWFEYWTFRLNCFAKGLTISTFFLSELDRAAAAFIKLLALIEAFENVDVSDGISLVFASSSFLLRYNALASLSFSSFYY